MYIKEIKISNFRNFKEASVPFHEGVNVIIGHNNTGKSNLLRAMGLVLGRSDGRRLDTSDLFYETDVATLQQQSPRIQITLVLCRSLGFCRNGVVLRYDDKPCIKRRGGIEIRV